MPKPIKPRKIEKARRSLMRDYFRANARKDIPASEIKRVSDLAKKLALEKARYSAAMSTDLKEVRQRSLGAARSQFAKEHSKRREDRAIARIIADWEEYIRNRHSIVRGMKKGAIHNWEDQTRLYERKRRNSLNPTATETKRLENMKKRNKN